MASVLVVFALNGAALGSWATRVPALTSQVDAVPGELGLAMLGASIGMVVAAAVSGRLVERFGPRAIILGSGLFACASLPVIGSATSLTVLGVALFLIGASTGVLDVSMNVAAVAVERQLLRSVMPIFHSGFSFGALIASLGAGLAAAQEWSPTRHLGVAAVVAAAILASVGKALPSSAARGGAELRDRESARGRPAVRNPQLWLLSAIPLCSAIAEGASSDWSALLLVTEHGVGEGGAALAFSGFSLAMAIARLAGAWTQRRFGARAVLVTGALSAGCGLLAAAVIPLAAVAYLGFVVAGIGLAGAFPIALGLAGEVGKRADNSGGEREIAFVTTLSYSGFLVGPPLIGAIAQGTSLAVSFLVVGAIGALIAPASVAATRATRRRKLEASEPRC